MRPWVVITGASRGIGRAAAELLAKRGADLCLVGRPSPKLDQTLSRCTELGGHHLVAPCELQQPPAIESAADRVLERGAPRALVNVAGVVERARLEDMTLESFERQMNVNLRAPIWLTRALLPAMRAAGRGAIVNVASISATVGSAGQIGYNASKWALVGFTKSLAEELSDSGLSAVAVLPGAVATDMLEGSPFPARMSADDVAKTLVHYALDAPVAHNGAVIEMFGV